MRSLFLAFACTALFALATSAADSPAKPRATERSSEAKPTGAVRFDPVLRDVEGWRVHVEPALLDGAHREEGAKALAMLANHLQRIKILVLGGARDKISVSVWIPEGVKVVRGGICNPFAKGDDVSKHWQAACRHW